MKFTLVKDLAKDTLMRPLLTGVIFFLLLFLVSDLFQKESQIGLHVNSVNTTLYGNEEEFLDPISLEALLEIIHADIFFMMMTLLVLCAIYGRLASKSKKTYWIIHSVNISAFASVVLLLIAFKSSAIITPFWLLAVCFWHVLALMMSLESLYRLFR
ncbi:MAG: hypothetical protein U9P71_01970 [Campylobacterota bacterium]|nr:hypothetical protein [Campylobacterota bacterium]